MDALYLELIDQSTAQAKRNLDRLILSTPTGPVREKLTEANIHLIAMSRAVQEATELDANK